MDSQVTKYSKIDSEIAFCFSVNSGDKSYMLTILTVLGGGGYENNVKTSKQIWQHIRSYFYN